MCREGMKADFTVLDGNMLQVLQQGGPDLPQISGTYVDGKCRFGC